MADRQAISARHLHLIPTAAPAIDSHLHAHAECAAACSIPPEAHDLQPTCRACGVKVEAREHVQKGRQLLTHAADFSVLGLFDYVFLVLWSGSPTHTTPAAFGYNSAHLVEPMSEHTSLLVQCTMAQQTDHRELLPKPPACTLQLAARPVRQRKQTEGASASCIRRPRTW